MRKLLYALAAITLLFTSWAQAAPELRSDHPERYTVVKGDTLWDISARFLKQPSTPVIALLWSISMASRGLPRYRATTVW